MERRPGCVSGVEVRLTLKLDPSAPTADVVASLWRVALSSWIARAPLAARLTFWPFLAAEAPVMVIVPKSSSGKTPPRPALGASSIQSAEEFDELYCTVSW